MEKELHKMLGICSPRLWMTVAIVVTFCDSSDVPSCVPHFLTEPASTVVTLGANVTLFCDARPNDVTLAWTHNGVELGTRHSVSQRTRKTLQLRLKSSSVEGVYRCYASNSCGTIVSRNATVSRAVLLPDSEQLADREIVTVRGNVAMIPCARANSIPPASVQFEFNGRTLKLANRHAIMPSGNLQIRDVGSSDDGIYRCVFVNPITNEKLPSKNTVHLRISESAASAAPRFTWTPLTNVEVISGQTLTLECVAEGWPVPVVQWLKYGGHLPAGRYSQLLGNLIIENVQEGDEGTYICRAENVAGQPQANVVFVEILAPPRIILAPSSQNASLNSFVTMHCHVAGKPVPAIWWFHNGIPLSQRQHVIITDESLFLSNIQSDSAGIYQCMAVNDLGTAHSSAQLSLHNNGRPASTVRKQNSDDDDDLPADDTHVSLLPDRAARSQAKSRHDYASLRKVAGTNHGLGNSRQNHMDEEEDQETEGEDRSLWQLAASDDLRGQGQGRDGRRKAAKETIDVKLVPPSKPNVTKMSDTSVMLHWTVPPNDGLRITFFKIQYKEITDNQRKTGWRTVDKDISPMLFSFKVDTGLKSGNTYQFRMVAVYSNFDNKHSPNSIRVTLGSSFRHRIPQNSPIIVRVWSTSSTTLSIEWQYMLSERVAIDGFYIYYKRYDTEMDYIRQTILGPDVRVTLLTGLNVDTHYSIRMQCFNAFGQSEFSNTATKFTLAGSFKSKTSSPSYEILERSWLYSDRDIEDVVDSIDDYRQLGGRVSPAASIRDLATTNVYYAENRQRMLNNETLYIILGTVIGTMLIVFVMSLTACMWKQCQQRRILALLENGGSYGGRGGGGGTGVGDVEKCCSQHPYLYVASSKKPDKQSNLCQPCNKIISRQTSSSYIERTIDDMRSSLDAITQTENMVVRNEEGEEEFSSVEEQCFSNQSLHLLQLNIKKLQQFSVPERHSVAMETVYATGEIRVETTAPIISNGSHFCDVDTKSAEDLRFPQIVKQHHHHRHHHHHHHPGRQGLSDCHRHHHHRHNRHHNQRLQLEQQQRVTSLT